MQLAEATLDRPGCRVRYRWRPSETGDWWILLHGAGMDGHMFDANFGAVPEGTGLACWDARGHGGSTLAGPFRYLEMLADLEALTVQLGADRPVLIGQSMGGNLAQSYASRHPEGVSRLVLIDCTDNHGALTAVERMALGATGAILGLYPWKAAVLQSARACGTAEATVAYAEGRLSAMGKKRFIEVMDFWRDALDPDPSYQLPAPTLAVLGEKDPTGNIAAAMRAWPAKDPSVTLAVIPSASHNSNMDRPDVVNETIRGFVCG